MSLVGSQVNLRPYYTHTHLNSDLQKGSKVNEDEETTHSDRQVVQYFKIFLSILVSSCQMTEKKQLDIYEFISSLK